MNTDTDSPGYIYKLNILHSTVNQVVKLMLRLLSYPLHTLIKFVGAKL